MSGEPPNMHVIPLAPRARTSASLKHARRWDTLLAVKLTKLAQRFQSRVWISPDGQWPWTDAKAIELVVAMQQPVRSVLHSSGDGYS